jgi:hypothetical protein
MDQQAPVLVVVVNDPTDLARARDAHWYRIPLRSAPPRAAAEYLAFYQTAAFPPEERWQIRWIAPVRGYYLASRKELIPEEPTHPHADDLYHKVTLGPLAALPRPIHSRRLRRITFIATIAGRLCHAQEINDLWIRTGPQERLWAALQDAELEAECRYPIADDDEEHSVDFALPCRDGRVAVMVESAPDAVRLNEATDLAPGYLLVAHGWTTVLLSAVDIIQDASGCVARLTALCIALGGVV